MAPAAKYLTIEERAKLFIESRRSSTATTAKKASPSRSPSSPASMSFLMILAGVCLVLLSLGVYALWGIQFPPWREWFMTECHLK